MLTIDIISVQPQMLKGFLEESIMARAVKKGAVKINIVDLKEYGIGRWKKTDDKPYGGGPGMLMRCEPWFSGNREQGTGKGDHDFAGGEDLDPEGCRVVRIFLHLFSPPGFPLWTLRGLRCAYRDAGD